MRPTFTAAVHREDDRYVARCPELDIASQGRTFDEALTNVCAAVEIYLEECARHAARPDPG